MALPGEYLYLPKTRISNYDTLHKSVNQLPPGTYVFVLNIPTEDLGLLSEHLHQIRSVRDRTITEFPQLQPPTLVITINSA